MGAKSKPYHEVAMPAPVAPNTFTIAQILAPKGPAAKSEINVPSSEPFTIAQILSPKGGTAASEVVQTREGGLAGPIDPVAGLKADPAVTSSKEDAAQSDLTDPAA